MPSLMLVSNSFTPGTSPAIVTSKAKAMSGSTPKAAVAAPRKPSSSCTVPTAQIVQSASLSSFRVSIIVVHPARLSNALPITILAPMLAYFSSKTMESPIEIPISNAVSLFSTPASMNKSSYVMIFFRSSSFWMCGGLEPIMPESGPFFVQRITLWARRMRSSIPPIFEN